MLADIEGRDLARPGPELFHERDNWKGVALAAFELDPALMPAGTVRRISAFCDHTLQPHLARLSEHARSLRFEMLDVNERRGRLFQQQFKAPLAFQVRQFTQVVTVQVQKVECIVEDTRALLRSEL